MQYINFFSSVAMPFVIFIIVIYGFLEKIKIFDIFLAGAKEGIDIVISIFPTLIGLFLAIGALRSSGILDCMINFITPLLNKFNFPTEIVYHCCLHF